MSTQFTNRQWRLPNNENKDKVSNYSMDFDSANSDYIDAGNPTELQITGPLTISYWFKTTNTGYQFIVTKDDGTNSCFDIGLRQQKIYATIYSSGLTDIETTTTWTDGDWHNVVFVFTPSTSMEIFVDGNSEVIETTNIPASIDNDPASLNIGRRGNNTRYYTGKIDGVSIFNYALSSSQVTTLYGSSSTGIGNPMSLSPKPVAYYPLGDQDAFNGANYLVPNSSLKDYVFNGGLSSNYVFNSNINQSNTGGKFTVSFWAKNSTNQQVSFSHGTANYTGAFQQQSGQMIVWLAGGVFQYFSYPTSDPRTDGKWHHYVVYVDTNTVTDSEVWIDKVQMTKGSGSSGTINAFTSGFIFKPFLGDVSNMMYFINYEIDQANVNVLYNNGSPITSTSGLSTAPDHWWKLNASDTYDSSTGNWTIKDHAGSNDGTSSGMTQANLVQSDLSFTSGYSPYALDFDGTNDYINIGTGGISTISSSLSIWFKTSSTDANNGFFGLNDNSIDYYISLLQTGGTGALQFWDGSAYTYITPVINDGNWHNLVVTYDHGSSLFKAYTDGAETYSATYSQASGMVFKIIGSTYSISRPWDGNLSNASLWSQPLTSSQVTEIYNEGVPSNLNNHSAYSNLVGWWQLGSNSSFNTNWTVLDEKGSNHGTSPNMTEDNIVDGVGSYANGLSSGMGGDEVIGNAPYSIANALSINMDVEDRVTDTPS